MLTQLYLRGRVLVVALFAVFGVTALWGHVTRTVTTNAQGPYAEEFVGNYDVRVSMMGFQNSVQTSVLVVVFTAGREILLCLAPRCDRTAQLPSLVIGSDRALGRDLFGVA
jgi:hypothetical protein